ncbi:hypothetical protein [Hyphococcus luteus]|uniref:Uncharacterized protein n=1 Tax=Hyphococcus luteus TaxID=2058213 RepID=A0A2S7K6M3_9PROT|nr:hypothetical protein [Marinicaulis flavus]PQA88160.1 hypothetical protein CW354_07555 [Marinicaulis flavus]
MAVETQERQRKEPGEAENTAEAIRVSDHETADGQPEALTTEEVRQGHTGDHVRYILMASVAGAVFVMAIVAAYFFN